VFQATEHRRRSQQLDARRGQLESERQAVEPFADHPDRIELGRVRPQIRPNCVCSIEEQRDSVVASKRMERELLLAAHSQSGTARYCDLQIRTRGDDGCKRRGGIHDLLEVVEDEENPTTFEM